VGNFGVPVDGGLRPGRVASGVRRDRQSLFCAGRRTGKSNDLFLADKVHVLRTMLRERPDDSDALREEVELESAARRYEQFYIRLLDENNTPC